MNKKRVSCLTATIAVLCLVSACSSEMATSNDVVMGAENTELDDVAAGAGLESAETYVMRASEELENAPSFSGNLYLSMHMDKQDETIIDAEIEMVKEPLQMKILTTNSFGEESWSSRQHWMENESDVDWYANYDGSSWTQMTMSMNDAQHQITFYDVSNSMQLLLDASENLNIDEEIVDGNITISGVIPTSEVYRVMEEGRFFQLLGMSGLSETYFSGISEVPVSFQLSENEDEPLVFSADFTEALDVVTSNVQAELNISDEDGAGVHVAEYVLTGTVSNLGTVEALELPEEARENAINYEREIAFLRADETETVEATSEAKSVDEMPVAAAAVQE